MIGAESQKDTLSISTIGTTGTLLRQSSDKSIQMQQLGKLQARDIYHEEYAVCGCIAIYCNCTKNSKGSQTDAVNRQSHLLLTAP